MSCRMEKGQSICHKEEDLPFQKKNDQKKERQVYFRGAGRCGGKKQRVNK